MACDIDNPLPAYVVTDTDHKMAVLVCTACCGVLQIVSDMTRCEAEAGTRPVSVETCDAGPCPTLWVVCRCWFALTGVEVDCVVIYYAAVVAGTGN